MKSPKSNTIVLTIEISGFCAGKQLYNNIL
jgi:hypothetical protein